MYHKSTVLRGVPLNQATLGKPKPAVSRSLGGRTKAFAFSAMTFSIAGATA